MRSARQGQHTSLVKLCIDVLFTGDPTYLMHRGTHGQQQIPCLFSPETFFQATGGYRKIRRTPTAIASRRAESGNLFFYHGNPQRRLVKQQVIRRPQPGIARTKNGDIHFGRPGELRTRR